MIEAVSGTRPLLIPNIIRAQNSNRKLAVPVKPYVALYTQFKHVRGIPSANDGGSSIPVSKLMILDNLIEKLVGKNGQGESYLKISGQDVDQLISKLESEYTLKNIAAVPGAYKPGPETGILLDILA